MARAAIAVNAGGVKPNLYTGALSTTQGNSSDNHTLVNTGRTLLHVVNTSGSAVTVTVVSVADSATGRTGDIAVSVGNNTTRIFGPFPKSLFNQSGDVINVNVSAGGSSVLLAGIEPSEP
jgi:hypothetical protein